MPDTVETRLRMFLVRHGETEANRQGRYLGWDDPPLSAEGLSQAERLAERLASEQVAAVYSSDLRRAADTADLIARRHGLTVISDPGLREANFGAWTGLTYDEIAARAPAALRAWIDDPMGNAPPDGETLAALSERVYAAAPRRDGAVIVGHGGSLRTLLSRWLARPFWDFVIPAGSLTIVEWRGESVSIAQPRVGSGGLAR